MLIVDWDDDTMRSGNWNVIGRMTCNPKYVQFSIVGFGPSHSGLGLPFHARLYTLVHIYRPLNYLLNLIDSLD